MDNVQVLVEAISLVNGHGLTTMVGVWATMMTTLLVALPAIMSWDFGLDYHNLAVLTTAQEEAQFFGSELGEETAAPVSMFANALARYEAKLRGATMFFVVPADIAALPSQEEVDALNAPVIPARWDSEVVTEEINLEDLELDNLWDRIDAAKYAPITFNSYMRVA